MSSVAEVVRGRELLWNLALRSLRTRYRRSVLGWTWSLVNPLATVAVYSFVFGMLFRSQPPTGDPSGIKLFAFYLLTGLLPWQFFLSVSTNGMMAMTSNAALIRKVAFPRESLVLAEVLQGMVQFSIEITLLTVIIAVFGSAYVLATLPFTIVLMLLLAVFTTGMALTLAAVGVYFHDLPYLWTLIGQLWFFATPIVYTTALIEDINPVIRTLLALNPFAYFAEGFRATMYDGRFPGFALLGLLVALAGASVMIGWRVFGRLSRRFAEEL